MRVAIAAGVAAAIAVGLAFAADAAPAKKKQKYAAPREKAQAVRPTPRGGEERFGYDASPEHYPVGSSQWWRAMEREGRGGFGDTM